MNFEKMTVSDYMQDIVENEPPQDQSSNSAGDHLEGSDAIDAIGVIAVFRSGAVPTRTFRTFFLTIGFFPALFHERKLEGTL
jgi:hypothetical protein